MSKRETLKVLVTERLTAAAEDIFALFERTIAEYEEELCRSQRENEKKQRLLDAVLNPRVVLPTASVGGNAPSPNQNITVKIKEEPDEQSIIHEEEQLRRVVLPTASVGVNAPSPNQNITVMMKEEPEEQSIIHEEEQMRSIVPESSAVRVKTEEPPLREDTLEEDMGAEQHFHSDSEEDGSDSSSSDSDDSSSDSDSDDDGSNSDTDEPADSSWNGAPLENDTGGNFTPQTSVSGTKMKKYQCSFCAKKFRTIRSLKTHCKIHLERGCSRCEKSKPNKKTQENKPHINIKSYACPMCSKPFAQLYQLKSHLRVHTGERPYSCFLCDKSFTQKCNLNAHMKLHTGERPFRCSLCDKGFTVRWNLKLHMKTHAKMGQTRRMDKRHWKNN